MKLPVFKVDPTKNQEQIPSSFSTSQTEDRSRIQDLFQVLRFESAVNTIERDLLQQSQAGHSSTHRQLLGSVLHRQLSARLSEAGLTPEEIPVQERPSVIFPPQSPRTSTPASSPPPPPHPPRYCQSIGQLVPIIPPRPCSPSCSELSSIDGDVFSDGEQLQHELEQSLSPAERAPGAEIFSTNSNTMEAAEQEIEVKSIALNRLMRNFDTVDVTLTSINNGEFKEEFDKVKNICNELVENIEHMINIDFKDTIQPQRKDLWNKRIILIEKTVREYKMKMRNREEELKRDADLNPAVTSYQQQHLDLTRQQSFEKKAEASAKAKVKFSNILKLCGILADKVSEVNDWEEESDLSIGRTMKKIENWEKEVEKINALNDDLKELVLSNEIPSDDVSLDSSAAYVDKLSDDVEAAIKAVREEDDKRALYTLDTAKSDPIKMPIFEGKDDEDFTLFREKVEKAFVQNRTTKADQLEKLRESLQGYAKKLIPENSTQTIEQAWEILKKAYGDPERIMDFFLDALEKCGKFPIRDAKGGIKNQIEWLLKIETIIQKIEELGDRDTDLADVAFSKDTIRTIVNLFPYKDFDKMNNLPGRRKIKFQAVLKEIVKIRERLQNNVKDWDDDKGGGSTRKGKKPGGVFSTCSSGSDNATGNSETFGIQGLVAYNPPRKDPKCRICQTLESKGDTQNIYEDHVHSFPSGCPRYAAMTTEQRLDIASKAKLCLKCHDPDYQYKKGDSHDCRIVKFKNVKGRFTCKDPKCLQHMWVCVTHKESNKADLQKFQVEFRNKYSMDFALMVTSPKLAKKTKAQKRKFSISRNNNLGNEEATIGQVKEVESDSVSPSPIIITTNKKTTTAPQVKEVKSALKSHDQIAAQCEHKSLSTGQAQKKLKYKLKAKEVTDKLRPVPKGRAQFMIGNSEGKTRDLLTLYDSGCYSVLFAKGVPEKELGPAVMKTKGPFQVNAVGDTSVTVNNEWMCSIGLIDGTRQVLEGWDVDRITAALPYIDMRKAELEIKSNLPGNEELQQLGVEPQVGGDVDILLGITYNSIFPTAVHSLENGLTIYKLQITSKNKRYNSVIGGPHESFQQMADHAGSIRLVFVNLMRQLENYKKLGPPKLSSCIMTVEDLEFASKHKEWEMENFCKERFESEFFDQNIPEFPEEAVLTANDEDTVTQDKFVESAQDEVPKEIPCKNCGTALSMMKSSEEFLSRLQSLSTRTDDDDEYLSALRKLQYASQEGLNIEYRCPRCRNCNDCRRSHETERVSLREEAEDLMIWDSVEIDRANHKIICYLPLRGEEQEFLSNNRNIALKVLDQQCYKYANDEETKNTIVKAFEKLMKNKQMVLWSDLTEEQKRTIEGKEIQHYIPWRIVFKSSISTPARPVFDASTKTKLTEDNKGGRCLNDLVVKGRIVTLNLVRMVLRFQTGKVAVQGDLKQFYASIKLVERQWNLQRVLYRPGLDPKAEALEAVIKTLIWGVKSVSAQSECSIMKLAQFILQEYPALADFLINSRYVDDLGDSAELIEQLKEMTKKADELFEDVELYCKGWSYSGSDPPPEVAEDDGTVSIGGMRWHPRLDLLEVLIPKLHFSKKLRGRLPVNTEVFEGDSLDAMNSFVPKKLTRTMIFSKNASLFDITGKFAPIAAGLKLDLRAATKLTKLWTDSVPEELRSKWVHNFWKLESLRGLKFQRARMPQNAVNTRMNLIVACDMAKWIESYIVFGDSTIALCWVTSDKKRLSLFHRNRCVQIRRGTDLDMLFHVVTECNPADIGTRPAEVSDEDIGPNGKWEKGLPWMREELDDAIEQGILTPAVDLRMNDDEEDSFKKGLVFEKSQEILTRGHTVMLSSRIEKVKERAEFSDYLLFPTKFKLEKVVRTVAIIYKFLNSFKCLRGKLKKSENKFQMLQVNVEKSISEQLDVMNNWSLVTQVAGLSFGVKKPGLQFKGKHHVNLTSEDISDALNALFKRATLEVFEFNKKEFINKIAVEKSGILMSRSRIFDGQRFKVAGGLENTDIMADYGINVHTPVLDRHSPLSYSVAEYIHRVVSKHSGYETCYRDSLNFCFIIQGMGLFRELGEECVSCAKLRKRYINVEMGPISDEQLVIAPPFWVTMMDMFGPCYVYVPGHSMYTRSKKVIEVKVWVLVFACPTTKMVNLQVIEGKSADAVVEGVTRLCCEQGGVPSFVLVDQDSSIVKVLSEAEVNMKDLELMLHREKGIQFKTCPVAGHNFHGLVEKKIRTVQECLEKCDIANMRLHATGLQTYCKLVENDMNSLPMGYSYGRDSDNSPILRLVFPNMLKSGKLSARALDGPVRMPSGPGELMQRVEKGYKAFFKLWNVTMIPKLMKSHKWFNSNCQLMVGDIIYFQKDESELSSKWTIGKVTEVIVSKDGLVRRVEVTYQNANESKPRTTDRASRSLIKLFHIDDQDWQADMAEVERLVSAFKQQGEASLPVFKMSYTGDGLRYRLDRLNATSIDGVQRKLGVQNRVGSKTAKSKFEKPCGKCCCASHCAVAVHESRRKRPADKESVQFTFDYGDVAMAEVNAFHNMLDRSWMDLQEFEEEVMDSFVQQHEDFMGLLCSVNTDLSGVAMDSLGFEEYIDVPQL